MYVAALNYNIFPAQLASRCTFHNNLMIAGHKSRFCGKSYMKKEVRPLSQRRGDWIILIFFTINLLLITYIVDLEQLVISDPSHFTYPVWPPAAMIDMVHNYGRTYDPVLIARPAW